MKLSYKNCLFLGILVTFLFGFVFKWNLQKVMEFSSIQFSPEKNRIEMKASEKCLQAQLPALKYVCKGFSIQSSLEFPKVDTEDKPQVMLMDFLNHYWKAVDSSSENSQTYDTDMQICKIMNDINQLIPNVTFSHLDNTTSVKNSKAFIVNPRDRYFIGDVVSVQLDMYDFLGNRKTHGGDLFRTRIYSPDVAAGSAGKITDFHNGSYRVQFTLFWEGKVKISLLFIHPSEAVSALWRARNTAFDYINTRAKFTSPTETVETKCSYHMDTKEELCDYMSEKNEYPLYCVKPANMSCGSLTQLGTFSSYQSHLSALERSLFDSSRFPVRFSHGLGDLVVVNRTNATPPVMEKCKFGMKPEFPGGHFVHNIWYPASCSMKRLTEEEINSCLQGRSLRIIGDSTLIQWFGQLTSKMKSLKELDLHDWGWQKSRLMVDPDRNIRIKFQKHGDPFLTMSFYQVIENPTIPQEIDRIGGNKDTVIVFTVATHFKPFPLHLFLRRVMNVRKALQRLFVRSPETKVVVKTENTASGQQGEADSDFHGYIQYLIMNSMLKDLNVGIVDAWEITTAFESNVLHAPWHVIDNEINLFLTMLC